MLTVCDPGRSMRAWRTAAVAAAALLAGCGGGENIVERSEFIVELENPLGDTRDEPDVYGQIGLTPTEDGGTRIAIKLDEPFDPAEAAIHRGGCGYFEQSLAAHRLGTLEDGELETVVDAPLRELRREGFQGLSLVVHRPIAGDEPEETPAGACADLSTAEPTEDPEL
jgi:hypothetical protein